MYRREFIRNSSLVIGAVIVGLPSLAGAFDPEIPVSADNSRPRLAGHKRLGCARALDDPKIALQLPTDFPLHFA